MKKVTEFEGYVSGDYECFCLSKIPFSKWKKTQKEDVLLYPDDFFPAGARGRKCKFRITVEAEIVSSELREKK